MGPGSPRSPTFTTPAPGLSCALAPILPHQQQLFLFPAVFSQQPSLGGGMGQQEEREGLEKAAAGLCPFKGGLPPPGRGPSRNKKCKTTTVTQPHSVLELGCETPTR